jgi:hypothetical protein
MHVNRQSVFIAANVIKQISIFPAMHRRYSVYFPVLLSALAPFIHPLCSFYMSAYEVDVGSFSWQEYWEFSL